MVAPLGELVQLAADRLCVSCKTKPAVFGVHEMRAKPGAAGTIVSAGAFAVCTAVGRTQNPPVTEYCPLVMVEPASGWPMVTVMV